MPLPPDFWHDPPAAPPPPKEFGPSPFHFGDPRITLDKVWSLYRNGMLTAKQAALALGMDEQTFTTAALGTDPLLTKVP